MKRKSMMYGGAVVFILMVSVLTLAVVLRHEPVFYRSAAIAASPERKKGSMKFVNACLQLGNGIKLDSKWWGKFTTEETNSYLAENFLTDGTMEELLPHGVRDPRIGFEDGRIRLGFRYGRPPWSTVVSVDLRVWLVAKEYNMVALELERVRAGMIPISGRSVLERMGDTIRQHNRGLEFNWYRHDGKPVALLRFQADKVVPTIRLQQMEVKDGQLLIAGCAFEAQAAPK
jgi:hypothetical protein